VVNVPADTVDGMSERPRQSIVTVSGRDLDAAAVQLRAAIEELPAARVVSLVSDVNRWTSLSGRATLVAVVDHE
jgi:hypothetical protein